MHTHKTHMHTVHTQPFRLLKYGVLDSFFSIQRAQTVFLFWIWCVAGVCLFIATVRFSFVFVHEMSNFVIYQYTGSRSYIRWSYYINRLAERWDTKQHSNVLENFKLPCAVVWFVFVFLFKFFFLFIYLFFLRILDALHAIFSNAVSARWLQSNYTIIITKLGVIVLLALGCNASALYSECIWCVSMTNCGACDRERDRDGMLQKKPP